MLCCTKDKKKKELKLKQKTNHEIGLPVVDEKRRQQTTARFAQHSTSFVFAKMLF